MHSMEVPMRADPGNGINQDRPSRARNKLWSQDAMAEIYLLRAKLDIISERQGLSRSTTTEKPPADGVKARALFPSAMVHPPDVGSANDTGLPGPRRITRLHRPHRHAAPYTPDMRTTHEAQAIREAVDGLLTKAELAANGSCPKYHVVKSWWSGNCIEAAFLNAHNAEATLATLFDDKELTAEIPEAVRRVRECLRMGDPVRGAAEKLLDARNGDGGRSATVLSRVVEAGHAAADRQRSRLRTFRNVLLMGILVTTLLLLAFIALAAWRPSLIPLCFVQDPAPADLGLPNISCPTRALRTDSSIVTAEVPSRLDVLVVASLGLMGGALSAALFIRDLYSNATPYNISIPLAVLKLPAGALTGLVGIILLAGEFVPGFSAIDKQIQILAYALVFGFAQQLFTQFVDQRAQSLVDNVPTKARGLSSRTDGGGATRQDLTRH